MKMNGNEVFMMHKIVNLLTLTNEERNSERRYVCLVSIIALLTSISFLLLQITVNIDIMQIFVALEM